MEASKHKKRVAVLRGGPSEEYDISMMTGAGVLESLRQSDTFYPVDIIVNRTGEWLMDGRIFDPVAALSTMDAAFLAFHGAYGEDGTVQRFLERHSIPYTGSGPYASALAMNKVLTKDHLRDLDIKLAPHMLVKKENVSNVHNVAESITALFEPEYVVKPTASGSSVGVLMAKNVHELALAIQKSLDTYDEVLVEKRLTGREATCGVVENFRDKAVYTLPAVEIVPPQESDFFDRENKYDGSTEEICPGRFRSDEKVELERVAELVHRTLGLKQYSRSDFIVADTGIYFLEVNTLPGLTAESLLPKSLTAVGASYGEFIEHLLTDTLTN